MSWEELERLHTDYLTDVVEALDVCPFAKRSRVQGRVRRPLFFVHEAQPCMEGVAGQVARTIEEHPDVEIILLTFVCPEAHPWRVSGTFEAALRALRVAYDALEAPRFYMVSFHPNVDPPDHPNPDNFVRMLRRTPDPVIQCVRADMLDRVRQQANARHQVRMVKELEAQYGVMAPELKEVLLAQAPPNHLSDDIAQRNFQACHEGGQAPSFEAHIQGFMRRRAQLEAWVSQEAMGEVDETPLWVCVI